MTQAETLAKMDPEIQQAWWESAPRGVSFKYETPPFNDIRVRKALQLAVNIPEIAAVHYKGMVDKSPGGLASPLIGDDWVVPYNK